MKINPGHVELASLVQASGVSPDHTLAETKHQNKSDKEISNVTVLKAAHALHRSAFPWLVTALDVFVSCFTSV